MLNELVAFVQTTFFIPRPEWSVDDIPDLKGKVVLVTGANTGIGKETAKVQLSSSDSIGIPVLRVSHAQILLSRGARVYLACRSRERAENAISDILTVVPKCDVHFLELDLSKLASVERAAKLFLSYAPWCFVPADHTIDD
jgi:retinol dehydrogenase 12